MAKPVKGSVVVIAFPFSDLSQSKRRPALVVVDLPGEDLILCQITSHRGDDPNAVEITDADFLKGGLKRISYARIGKLFTADRHLILYTAGELTSDRMSAIMSSIIALFQR